MNAIDWFWYPQQADFLGYPTHASFITEMRLAKTATNVKSFLTDLAAKLKDLWAEEKQLLLQYKEDEVGSHSFFFPFGQITE